jgi:hypothetical protein
MRHSQSASQPASQSASQLSHSLSGSFVATALQGWQQDLFRTLSIRVQLTALFACPFAGERVLLRQKAAVA